MGLHSKYPPDFERIWKAYPDWPKGRSKKRLAFLKWQALKKEGWTDEDTNELIDEIETRKRRHEYWQRGHRFGPQALQVFLYQRAWEDDYPTVKQPPPPRDAILTQEDDEENQRKLIKQLMQYGQTIEDLRRHGHRIPEGME